MTKEIEVTIKEKKIKVPYKKLPHKSNEEMIKEIKEEVEKS